MTAAPSLGLRLSRTQQAFVDDRHRYSLFLGGIGAGKSYAGAVKALAELGRPSLGMVVAPTYPMLRDATWRTALEVWGPLVESVVRNEMRVVLRGGSEVLFRSADEPDRLRGPNVAWGWIDEAAQCHPETWPIVIGRLRQHGEAGRCWLTTTPKGMNWLYEVFVVNANDDTATFRATTRANPFLPLDFVHSLRGQYEGEFARQELDAEFIADLEGALLEWAWLERARDREARYEVANGPVCAGIDVAGPGEDETTLCVRQGREILALHAWAQADSRGVVVSALRDWRARGLARVTVDSAGIGHYFAQSLKDELGPDLVREVNVGESPTSDQAKERFANLKAELYWALRERARDGDLAGLADQTAIGQLAGLRYSHDRRGRVVIESKEDARKRGVKSPDRAEALVLAFAPDDPRQRYGSAVGKSARMAPQRGLVRRR